MDNLNELRQMVAEAPDESILTPQEVESLGILPKYAELFRFGGHDVVLGESDDDAAAQAAVVSINHG